MNTANNTAVLNYQIPDWIRLDFYNNSNLKYDIQNRVSPNIETVFKNALNDMKGDNKNNYGYSFSEITRLALAYFYSEIFNDKIQNSYYTVEMVKGFLDADNLTNYTAIHEIDIIFYKLKEAPLYNHCWLVIQCAWFFNSKYFGRHQYIDYINHYVNTGQKLPIEQYNFDRNYLEKKYSDLDKAKVKIPVNTNTLICQWYYYILFLICKELNLSVTHFTVSEIDSREYNPLTKTPRQLRPLAPFKIIECDIKSAFPTFLDIEVGADLKDHVYNNLMLSKGISRGEAKILFNKVCNSGKYNSIEYTKQFFIDCGYTEHQSENLLYYTHNEKYKFISLMCEQEQNAIKLFILENNIQRCGRLHDSVLYIDNKVKPPILTVEPNCDFGYKELNKPVIKESFSLSNKRVSYGYVSSIPKGFDLITKHDFIKPKCKGEYQSFKIYTHKFQYITASFNLNNYHSFTEEIVEVVQDGLIFNEYTKTVFSENPNQIFISLCEEMIDTLFYLNKRKIKPLELELILKHIRSSCFYVFNVRATYLRLIRYNCKRFDFVNLRSRNFDFIDNPNFKTKQDFTKAYNEAIKNINSNNNYKDLVDLIGERIEYKDFAFLSENKVVGHRRNNEIVYAFVRKFNLLCTGSYYAPRKSKVCKPFNNDTVKRLQTFEIPTSTLEQVQQLYLMLCKLSGAVTEFELIENIDIQNQLKYELIQLSHKKIKIVGIDAGVNCFDFLYPSKLVTEIKFNADFENSFDTDLTQSVFNTVTPEEAHYRGEVFFKEYLKFYKLNQVKETIPTSKETPKQNLPEFDFDKY